MGKILISNQIVSAAGGMPLFSDIFPGQPDPRWTEVYSDSLIRDPAVDITTVAGWIELRSGQHTELGAAGAYATASASYSARNIGEADVDLSCTLNRTALPAGSVGLFLRASSDVAWNNCLRISFPGNAAYVYRVQGDTPEEIATGDLPEAGKTGDMLVRVTAVGDMITVYADGTQVLQVAESYNNDATRHGIMTSATNCLHKNVSFKVPNS